MQIFVALLRGINVGGNNILPMAELKSICEEAGFKNVKTYIQSGNVLFENKLSEEKAVKKLEDTLKTRLKNSISVIIRTIDELEEIISDNPFPDAVPSKVGVTFFGNKVPKDLLEGFSNKGPEEIVLSEREIFVYYPDGMGQSKLKLPKMAQQGTVRNINTVRKLAELAKKIKSN